MAMDMAVQNGGTRYIQASAIENNTGGRLSILDVQAVL